MEEEKFKIPKLEKPPTVVDKNDKSIFLDPSRFIIDGNFTFKPPPEAPIFYPTLEEFSNPLVYIEKIKPLVESTGICKIVPPTEWNPPFAIDVDNFKFKPRLQKLNELDGVTRVKLHFLDKLAIFWNYSGLKAKIPLIDNRMIDLYCLYKIVESEGGYELVDRTKLWPKISKRLGYVNNCKSLASVIKSNYKRLLLPYELFEKKTKPTVSSSSATTDFNSTQVGNSTSSSSSSSSSDDKTTKEEQDDDETDDGKQEDHQHDDYHRNNCNKKQKLIQTTAEKAIIIRHTRSSLIAEERQMLISDTLKKPSVKAETNKELQRLTFFCPGPKILNNNNKRKLIDGEYDIESSSSSNIAKDVTVYDGVCVICDGRREEDVNLSLLTCKNCRKNFHAHCYFDDNSYTTDNRNNNNHNNKKNQKCQKVNMTERRLDEWRCTECIANVLNDMCNEFGFVQTDREYNLFEFGVYADSYKSNYFKMATHLVAKDTVEREYWRLLSSLDCNETVQYAVDIQSVIHGSGFPTVSSNNNNNNGNNNNGNSSNNDVIVISDDDNENENNNSSSSSSINDIYDFNNYDTYANSEWNLNNIPITDDSVLTYIDGNICGMKTPWIYVGMLFSTFCWHNEDHWTYSINYLHWGEAKTWYGIPGKSAEHFERVMRTVIVPDLFYKQTDLLHQLVTTVNPTLLIEQGVPVYRVDQSAGEFVLTFPRAYHAGFNQGFNFAEAVNFAPADWIAHGRTCVDYYSLLGRCCVFSHDELICKMAASYELNRNVTEAVYHDLTIMLKTEREMRRDLFDWGVTNDRREMFELLTDDKRQCVRCNTTCFLSAVQCKCRDEPLRCLRHFRDHTCACPVADRTLKFRYTLDELETLLNRMEIKRSPLPPTSFA